MGVDAVLFGHTHQALVYQTSTGMWMVNPGTVGGIHATATYVNAYAEKGRVRFELRAVEEKNEE
jgi:predicted phosphodiesterase